MSRNDLGIAWAAGLFEGEGCITFNAPRPKAPNGTWRLQLNMTDEDVVSTFKSIVGVGNVRLMRTRREHKLAWRWTTSKRADVIVVLKKFLPFFGVRRAMKASDCIRSIAQIQGGQP